MTGLQITGLIALAAAVALLNLLLPRSDTDTGQWHRWDAYIPRKTIDGAWAQRLWRKRVDGRWVYAARGETEEEFCERQW